MGYTHYWRGTLTLTDPLISDIHKLLSVTSISIRGPSGTGDPTISTTDGIHLNGNSSTDGTCEPFSLTSGTVSFGFCKTARYPYDTVVGAVLLRCAHYCPEFSVSSDGFWDEWEEARELYEEAFGAEAARPERMTD
ncbi:hypothetical protein ABW19_dt0205777 [Dactylella cylindrospora]|nr:hypothetical protein ABW19_dt0205777 [Dactylella cylindrospora]